MNTDSYEPLEPDPPGYWFLWPGKGFKTVQVTEDGCSPVTLDADEVMQARQQIDWLEGQVQRLRAALEEIGQTAEQHSVSVLGPNPTLEKIIGLAHTILSGTVAPPSRGPIATSPDLLYDNPFDD